MINKKIFSKILIILTISTVNALALVNISNGNITSAIYGSRAVKTEVGISVGYWAKPSVEVISPNGGEEYEVNEEITIIWEAQSADPDSSIESDLYFSDDAGVHYTLIAADLEDIFSYDWTLPSVKSDQMLIKVEVEDEHGLTNSDESDAVFDPVAKDEGSEKDSSEEEDKNKDPIVETVAAEAAPMLTPTPTPEPKIEPPQPPEEDPKVTEEQEVVDIISSDPAPEPENSQDPSPAPDGEVQDGTQ